MSVEQLAQRHKLTEQQLQVLRQTEPAVLWRIITMPESAGMLAVHMIVELKQQHEQSEQEVDATHSITHCVYAPCGIALPAKDAQILITQHVMRAQTQLKKLEQQRRQLLASWQAPGGSLSTIRVISDEQQHNMQQQQQLLKADPEANASSHCCCEGRGCYCITCCIS
jgi:hypothetical protein